MVNYLRISSSSLWIRKLTVKSSYFQKRCNRWLLEVVLFVHLNLIIVDSAAGIITHQGKTRMTNLNSHVFMSDVWNHNSKNMLLRETFKKIYFYTNSFYSNNVLFYTFWCYILSKTFSRIHFTINSRLKDK